MKIAKEENYTLHLTGAEFTAIYRALSAFCVEDGLPYTSSVTSGQKTLLADMLIAWDAFEAQNT